jgi:SHS2 domain-containing protein
MHSTGHRFLDHTADVALEFWAPSRQQLLEHAASVITDLLTDGAPVVPDADRAVDVAGLDDEDLLVRWINEVLWLATGEGFVTASAKVVVCEHELHADLRGRRDAAHLVVTEIKSATYHGLRLAREPDGRWFGRVVLDV